MFREGNVHQMTVLIHLSASVRGKPHFTLIFLSMQPQLFPILLKDRILASDGISGLKETTEQYFTMGNGTVDF